MSSSPDLTDQEAGTSEVPNTASTSALDLTAYAAELRTAVRRLDASGPASWRAVVDRGLSEAYRQRDPAGLASMIQLIVAFLDAEGRVIEAISEIEHAIARSKSDPGTLAILEALRAAFLSASGDVEAATQAIAASEFAQGHTTRALALERSKRLCAGARLTTLADTNLVTVEELMDLPASSELESTILHLVSIYVPYRFALGGHTEARPWVRGLRMAAEAMHHACRVADADTFERADAAISELKAPSVEGLPA